MSNHKNFTAYELTLKHARLTDDLEKLPPGAEISSQILKKKIALEKELQCRLYSLLIGDVLPVMPTILDIIGIPKPVEKKAGIIFNFEVLSGLNTRLDRFKIEAFTKDEAWEKAKKKAKKYPGDVNLKIS